MRMSKKSSYPSWFCAKLVWCTGLLRNHVDYSDLSLLTMSNIIGICIGQMSDFWEIECLRICSLINGWTRIQVLLLLARKRILLEIFKEWKSYTGGNTISTLKLGSFLKIPNLSSKNWLRKRGQHLL
jgi:hypothetical protein